MNYDRYTTAQLHKEYTLKRWSYEYLKLKINEVITEVQEEYKDNEEAKALVPEIAESVFNNQHREMHDLLIKVSHIKSLLIKRGVKCD